MWDTGEIPWVSPKDMKTLRIIDSEDHVTEKALTKLTLAPAGAVLMVVRSGILCRTLPLGIGMRPVTVNQDMRVMLAKPGILPEYLLYQLISNETKILEACAKGGTTVASIEAPAFARYALHVAPTAEQVRIVAKLEELLSDLDAGVAELKAAQAKLGQYRQSLLKAAVDGSLTAVWRKTHSPTESGAQLLEHILTERRKRWEAKQLSKFQEQSKTPPKGWQDRYPQPVSPDTTNLPELPAGWVWATWAQVGYSQNGRPFPSAQYQDTGVKLLRPGNLSVSSIVCWNEKNTQCLPKAFLEDNRDLLIEANELVINLTAQSLKDDFLGRVCVTSAGESCLLNQRLARLTPITVSHKFMHLVFRSSLFRRFVSSLNTGSLIQHMFTSQMESFAFPLPSLEEQAEILEVVASKLSSVEDQYASTEHLLKVSAAQRKNILKAAFSGILVPQDPNDEPANVLLERIRAERGPNGTKGTRRGQNRGDS